MSRPVREMITIDEQTSEALLWLPNSLTFCPGYWKKFINSVNPSWASDSLERYVKPFLDKHYAARFESPEKYPYDYKHRVVFPSIEVYMQFKITWI